MTPDELIAEGRRLQRPATLLEIDGDGEPAAYWHQPTQDELDESEERRWLTINGSAVPGTSVDGFLTVLTAGTQRGRVITEANPPVGDDMPLYARPASILPPIDAVFALGSEKVGDWLRANGWERAWGYNGNFRDRAVVRAYTEVEESEHPYWTDLAPAMLGGWHLSWPEGDWHELLPEQLVAHTFWNSEPWVELWRLRTGAFKVIQRIT